eukprot:4906947-Ditylum_brightwellii.AAC.1
MVLDDECLIQMAILLIPFLVLGFGRPRLKKVFGEKRMVLGKDRSTPMIGSVVWSRAFAMLSL